jgi:hypothetical protein
VPPRVGHPGPKIAVEPQAVEIDEDLLVVVADVVIAGSRRRVHAAGGKAMGASDITECLRGC